MICSALVLNSQIYSTVWSFSHRVYLANEFFLSQSDLWSLRSRFISICVNETHDKWLLLKPCVPLDFKTKHCYHCNKDKSVWRVCIAFCGRAAIIDISARCTLHAIYVERLDPILCSLLERLYKLYSNLFVQGLYYHA